MELAVQNTMQSTMMAHSGFLVNTCDLIEDDRGDSQSQCVEGEVDHKGSQDDKTK